LEIQAAARKVARENAILRSLLKAHGVTYHDIEEYVRVEGKVTEPSLLLARVPEAPTVPQAEMLRQSILRNSMDGVHSSGFQAIPDDMLDRLEKGRVWCNEHLGGSKESVQAAETLMACKSSKPESCQSHP